MNAKQLRAALVELGLTRDQAAAWLRVDPTTIWRWLEEERRIPGPAIKLIELALMQARGEDVSAALAERSE